MRTFVLALVMVVGCGGGGSEKSCATSAECSTGAPYCADGASCSATCSGDADCPGFGQSTDEKFCEGGSCVACRAEADCGASTPVCDEGACRRCERNDECDSGVCATDGSCVAEGSVLYVSPNGGSETCTKAAPCTLAKGIALTPPRQFIVVLPGTHTLSNTLAMSGTRSLIGSGDPRPIITRTGTGPIITVISGAGSDISLDHLQLSGATSIGGGQTGWAVLCPDGTQMGMRGTVRMRDALVTQNESGGIEARKCTVEISTSTFTSTANAVSVVDTNATIHRNTFNNNTRAVFLDAGVFVVTNNFIYRNETGIELFANAGSVVEYNTIADNSMFGFSCQGFDAAEQFGNNLLARNPENLPNPFNCSFPNTISAGTDIAPIKFKSPDVAPFDYHIQAGSSALDLGSTGKVTTDFDGESRPFGSGADIGADELH